MVTLPDTNQSIRIKLELTEVRKPVFYEHMRIQYTRNICLNVNF